MGGAVTSTRAFLSPMAKLQLRLPTIQNWNCHNCAGCCRQHCIEVTEEERRRILDQKWTEADGIPARQPVIVKLAGLSWKRRYRLAHQSDGACIFLNEQGLCRIHAKYGEQAKPLPCRIYPYAFHPAGKNVAVSLRYSCPSVVENRGAALSEQIGEIRKIARSVVPEGYDRSEPPSISASEQLDWADTLRFVDALDTTLAESNVSLVRRITKALTWINLVGQATFANVRGDRLSEFLNLIRQAADDESDVETSSDSGTKNTVVEVEPPSRIGLVQFRLLVAQYARKDTFAERDSGFGNRLRLLRAATRFARGSGNALPLQDVFREVPFNKLEQPFGGIPAAADEWLTRYFRVKVQGLHFFGRAFYDIPLVEGFQSLATILPIILYLARWLAAGEDRRQLVESDVAQAIAIADHHHGYSPAFGQWNFRRRIRNLARSADITRLCVWYAR